MKRFKVLLDTREIKRDPTIPTSVPWELVGAHEAQAMKNHDQTLERLNGEGRFRTERDVCGCS